MTFAERIARPIQFVHAKQHGNPDGSRRVTATLMAQDQGDYPESCGLATESDLRAAGFVRVPSPDDPAAVEFFAQRMHEAWMRQSVVNGWPGHAYVAFALRDTGICFACARPFSEHHQSMRPYADLSEPVKELDRAGAREFLRALAEWQPKEAADGPHAAAE
ncbi:MAG: hypothetical protein KGK07_07455 [Chloroflexota bacterium]|nr:hypothetical protein [Chloroflexota bacterium]